MPNAYQTQKTGNKHEVKSKQRDQKLDLDLQRTILVFFQNNVGILGHSGADPCYGIQSRKWMDEFFIANYLKILDERTKTDKTV